MAKAVSGDMYSVFLDPLFKLVHVNEDNVKNV